MKTVTTSLKGMIAAGSLVCASVASAQELPASPAAADVTEVMSAADMEALSGGTGVDIVTITQQTLTATNNGNTVTGDTIGSGDANIGANAFSGFSGVGTFMINTGHNNNLQSSVNVSVVLGPAEAPQ